LFASLLFALAVVFWFLLRKKRQRIWLPILRVLSPEKRNPPKFSITFPPWLSFLCFVISALLIILFTLRPAFLKYDYTRPSQNVAHLFLDMSPSVLRGMSEQQYISKAVGLYRLLSMQGKVSVSTSHDPRIYSFSSSSEMEKTLQGLGIHRAGVKLGNAVKAQLATIDAIDRFIIMSDNDNSSWQDFNWQFLSDQMQVYLAPATDISSQVPANIYVTQINGTSNITSSILDWEVTLGRVGSEGEESGTISLWLGDKLAKETSFTFPSNAKNITFNVSMPYAEIEGLKSQAMGQTPLKWVIKPNFKDVLAVDNTFYTPITWLKQQVLLVGESSGERFLEDGIHHIEVGLAANGIHPYRIDRFPHDEKNITQYPLWFLVANNSAEVDSFCPLISHGTRGANEEYKSIWMAPAEVKNGYDNICQCLVRLIETEKNQYDQKTICSNLDTRDKWIGVLTSLGAKQIGGDIESGMGALAFRLQNVKDRLNIIAFTTALVPSIETSMTHATIPIVLHALLENFENGATGKRQHLGNLPRLRDISLLYAATSSATIEGDKGFSNVPIVESQLETIAQENLPPMWDSTEQQKKTALLGRKKTTETLPLLKLAIFIVLTCMLIESLGLTASLIKRGFNKMKYLHWFVLLAAVLHQEAKAAIVLNIVSPAPVSSKFDRIAREVVSRTSIDYAQDIKMFPAVNDELLTQPWMWVEDVQTLTVPGGELRPAIVSWLKKGGFLIISYGGGKAPLEKLTAKLLQNQKRENLWKVIPPDHELMRSFHLLDALPTCDNGSWLGFHYDDRLAILAVPTHFLDSIADTPRKTPCSSVTFEQSVRIYINILMVALTTDYKNDQVHLPEILKRLR
jgi:hypothetical protein